MSAGITLHCSIHSELEKRKEICHILESKKHKHGKLESMHQYVKRRPTLAGKWRRCTPKRSWMMDTVMEQTGQSSELTG